MLMQDRTPSFVRSLSLKFYAQAYVKQRLWLLQCCDAMCFLLREYCVGVSMAALSEQGPPVWMSYAQKRGLPNGRFYFLYEDIVR